MSEINIKIEPLISKQPIEIGMTVPGPQGIQGIQGEQGPPVPIANNLTTTVAGTALDATQGKVINDSLVAHKAESMTQLIKVSRGLSLAGVQVITGFIKKPKKITVYVVVSGTVKYYLGEYDLISLLGMTSSADGFVYLIDNNTISIMDSFDNRTIGTIQNITDNQLEINWVKQGTGATGTADILLVATYHGGV